MKILLAKSAHITSTAISILPPLGLLYLAGSVRRFRAQDEVKMIDLRVATEREYRDILATWRPDVVGISTITVESEHAHRLASIAKQAAKQTRSEAAVIVGGPHATGYFNEILADTNVDYAVLHEGELTFVELLNAIENRSDISGVQGIAYRNSSGIVQQTAARPYVEDLDQIPHPAWDLIDFKIYEKCKSMSLIGGARRVAPIFTSRACPYRCTYCHNIFGKKFQKRSVENVLEEIRLLHTRYGVQHFELVDDIFNIDKKRCRAILEGIVQMNIGIKLAFPNGLRGDIMDEDLVDLFARAGTEYVSIAIETASPRLQRQIKKNIRLEPIKDTIRWFVERRVFVNCFYMLGFPSETVEEMNSTVRYACDVPSHTAMFFIVTPYQGTEMNVELGGDVDLAYHRMAYYESSLNVSGNIPTPVLQRTAKIAYLRFLANPARIWRIMRDHPNKKAMWQAAMLLLHRVFFDNLNNRDMITRLRKAVGLDRPALGRQRLVGGVLRPRVVED